MIEKIVNFSFRTIVWKIPIFCRKPIAVLTYRHKNKNSFIMAIKFIYLNSKIFIYHKKILSREFSLATKFLNILGNEKIFFCCKIFWCASWLDDVNENIFLCHSLRQEYFLLLQISLSFIAARECRKEDFLLSQNHYQSVERYLGFPEIYCQKTEPSIG